MAGTGTAGPGGEAEEMMVVNGKNEEVMEVNGKNEERKEFIGKPKEKKEFDPYAPPDGGWGWVVMFASFACNLVLDGIAYVFGIFLLPMMQDYRVSKGPMATVGSTLAGTIQLAGPFVAILVER